MCGFPAGGLRSGARCSVVTAGLGRSSTAPLLAFSFREVVAFFDPAGAVLRCFPCRLVLGTWLISRKLAADSVGFHAAPLDDGRASEAVPEWSGAPLDVRCNPFSKWIALGLVVRD